MAVGIILCFVIVEETPLLDPRVLKYFVHNTCFVKLALWKFKTESDWCRESGASCKEVMPKVTITSTKQYLFPNDQLQFGMRCQNAAAVFRMHAHTCFGLKELLVWRHAYTNYFLICVEAMPMHTIILELVYIVMCPFSFLNIICFVAFENSFRNVYIIQHCVFFYMQTDVHRYESVHLLY